MDFLSNENLMLAYRKAKKSRKYKQEVYLWDLNFEENIIKLKRDLELWTYIHSEYKEILLFDSKKRYISSPNFRDHIVHHMVHNIIYPVFDKKFINTTYACRKWYGSHKAVKFLHKISKKDDWKMYYLKMDISKYFYSINHEKLKQLIFKHIKNQQLRLAISIIIDSYKTKSQFDYLFDENSKYLKNSKKWLPIWSILSQLFANIYLTKLDNYIKHYLKFKNYLRYMDDFLLIWTKEEIKNINQKIIKFVYLELDLVINPKKVSFNLLSDWIKFVWYKIFQNKIFVWKSIKNNTNKFLDTLNKINLNNFLKNDIKKINSSLNSRLGTFIHSSFGLNYLKKRGDIDIPSRG